ncbi:hypothetical protein ACFQI7_13025 [Paenibacillus allorhizosphaerae]|uniref:Uncharacterized protein n=1 Tax=Paenibacillus allorhizosphaerae TaxID=2849866 RepID=A0ABM8VLI0_9BACL|nr:hypothetical protein [Paenibacillus allorhizosphaerae]CAG7648137.1 hypothetical protein PAECIP111802_04134 [Paenibacillus allorhizosphaerae]
MKIKRFFGLRVETRCDRCHEKIDSTSDIYTLCKDCFSIDSKMIRQHETKLDYQRMVAGRTCIICKKTLINTQVNHTCWRCVSQHNDRTHSGWYINSDYDEGTKLYRSCICGDVLVITIGKPHQFEYYRVGNTRPTTVSYPCSREIKKHGECEHNWIVLAENETPYKEGLRKYKEYKQNPAMGLLLESEDDYVHLAFGSTKFWCSHCGLYHDLSPSKVNLLPAIGYIKHD